MWAAGIAAAVFVVGRDSGAFDVAGRGPLGAGLAVAAGLLFLRGYRPGRELVWSASLLVAFGCWSLLSTAWGGLPEQAWRSLDETIIGACALLAGAMAVTSERRRAALTLGLLGGLTLQAAEVLIRLAADGGPSGWIVERSLDGPVGYKNAQAAMFALGVPLAVAFSGHASGVIRSAAGAASGLLAAALLLSQSRGALIALAVGLAVQLGLTRRFRLVWFTGGLVLGNAVLGAGLRRVDAALLGESQLHRLAELRLYGVLALVVAAGLALLAWLPAPAPGRTRKVLGVAVAAAVVAGLLGTVLYARPAGDGGTTRSAAAAYQRSITGTGSPGATRLTSLSLTGRWEAWRVAAGMISESPLTGKGTGQFARYWTARRHIGLDILQPHSLELEALSELGVPGLVLLTAFIGVLVLALVQVRARLLAAAALACVIVLVGQSSVDWIWSFPALLAVTLFAAGVAAGSGRREAPPSVRLSVAAGLAVLGALVLVGLPYVADRQLATARSLEDANPVAAWKHAQSGRRLDPWNPQLLVLEGRLAERNGQPSLAARKYARAASLSQRPWYDALLQARALRAAGDVAASRRICRQAAAENPGEEIVYEGPCLYQRGGNAWPVVAERVPAGVRGPYALYRDAGCEICSVRPFQGGLEATVAGGADSLDTAYAAYRLGGPTGLPGRVYTRFVLRRPAGRALSGNVYVLDVHDVKGALVFALYLHAPTGELFFLSPPGALHGGLINLGTRVTVPADGKTARNVEVSALRNQSVIVRVDGVDEIKLGPWGAIVHGVAIHPAAHGLSGGKSGHPRTLRAGILEYGGWTTADPLRLLFSGVAANGSHWPGPTGAGRPRS